VTHVQPGGPGERRACDPVTASWAAGGERLDRYRVFLDRFGRTPAGGVLPLQVIRDGRPLALQFPLITDREAESRSELEVGSGRLIAMALTGYPLIFLPCRSRAAAASGGPARVVMALAFGGLIAGAAAAAARTADGPALRRFMVPIWVFLVAILYPAL